MNFLKQQIEISLTRDGYVHDDNCDMHFTITLIKLLNEYFTFKAFESDEQRGSLEVETGIRRRSHIFLDLLQYYNSLGDMSTLIKRMEFVRKLYDEISKILDNNIEYFYCTLLSTTFDNYNALDYFVENMEKCLHPMCILVMLTYVNTVKIDTLYILISSYLQIMINEISLNITSIQLKTLTNQLINTVKIMIKLSRVNLDSCVLFIMKKCDMIIADMDKTKDVIALRKKIVIYCLLSSIHGTQSH